MHILEQVLNLVKETEIMISMVLRNIQNSFINFRKIFILLIVSQIISIMSIFFVYGIYGSYAAKMQEIELNTYRIGIDFEEAEKNTVGTLKRNLPEVLDRINDKLEFVFVAGASNHKMVAMRTKYIDGDFRTVITKEQYGNMKGRYLNSEDDEKCNRVIFSAKGKEDSVGDIVDIAGTEFEIVGTCDDLFADGYDIPYNSCPDDLQLSWCSFYFKELPTVNDYNAIKKLVTGNFSNYTMDEFDIKNNDELTSYRTIIAISVSIGIISALNTCLMYGYIISQRRKQMVVYGIIGAARIRRFAISESEMLVFSVTTSLVGVVLFRTIFQSIVLKVYDNSSEIYTVKMYVFMTILYIMCILIFTSVLLAVMNRDKLADMLRRTEND